MATERLKTGVVLAADPLIEDWVAALTEEVLVKERPSAVIPKTEMMEGAGLAQETSPKTLV